MKKLLKININYPRLFVCYFNICFKFVERILLIDILLAVIYIHNVPIYIFYRIFPIFQ